MSVVNRQSHATTTQPLWLPVDTNLPQGPTGPTGATGPQGPQGISTGKFYYGTNVPTIDGTNLPAGTLTLTPTFNLISGTSIVLNTNGQLVTFVTDPNDPNQTTIPGGVWGYHFHAETSGTTTATITPILSTFDGTTITNINTGAAVPLIAGVAKDQYEASISVPTTLITSADRIVWQYEVGNLAPGDTVTLYLDDDEQTTITTTFYEAGPTGPTGPAGPTGASGPSGPPGATGPAGASGPAGPTGASGPQGPIGTGGALGKYGSFSSAVSQNIGLNTPTPLVFTTVEEANGVAIFVPNTRILIGTAGTYNIQFSTQLSITSGPNETITIWLRKNGNNVPDSATDVTLKNNEYEVAAWNFVYTFAAGDFFELVASSTGSNAVITAIGPRTAPTRPATPATILTVTQVMYTQVGPQGPTGATGPAGNPGAWSLFPAIQTVNMANNNINSINNAYASYVYGNSMAFGGTSLLPLANLTSLGNFDGQGVYCKPFTGLGFVDIDGTNWTGTSYALRSKGPVSLSGDGILSTISLGTNTVGGIDLTRIQLGVPTIGSIFMTAPVSIVQLATTGTFNYSGAMNIAAGGAISLAAGGYIEENTSDVRMINTTSGNQQTTLHCGFVDGPWGVSNTYPLIVGNNGSAGTLLINTKNLTGPPSGPGATLYRISEIDNPASLLKITGLTILGGTNVQFNGAGSINGTDINNIQTFRQSSPSGISGGFAPGTFSWFPRTLNTGIPALGTGGSSPTIFGMSLNTSTSEITVPAGTYLIQASVPGFAVGNHKCRLYNPLLGTIELLGSNSPSPGNSIITGTIVVPSTTVFELQQQVTVAPGFATDLGSPCTFGVDEVYSQISFTKLYV